MTNKEFCHWLQGYFELGRVKNKSTFVNKDQIELIRRRIEDMSDAYTCTFIQWLQGVIDATRVLKITNVDYVNISEAIKLKLDDYLGNKDEIIPAKIESVKFPPLRLKYPHPMPNDVYATDKLDDVLDKLPDFPSGRTPNSPISSYTCKG